MSGLIPEPPPVDPRDWSSLVGAYLFRGVYGGCVMCPDGTYDWWDLTLSDQPPVVDRTGTLTDQVALHPRCIAALVAHWASLTGEDSGVGEAAAPDVRPDAGVPPSDSFTDSSTDPFEQRQPRRARTGAYARHGGDR